MLTIQVEGFEHQLSGGEMIWKVSLMTIWAQKTGALSCRQSQAMTPQSALHISCLFPALNITLCTGGVNEQERPQLMLCTHCWLRLETVIWCTTSALGSMQQLLGMLGSESIKPASPGTLPD